MSGSEGAAGALIAAHQAKSLLRFITCGSVDDGKSTLIGRLLHDSRSLLVDQLAAFEHDGRDFAALVDGLAGERAAGITIDVAYRYFATPTRKFIVADTPGHEQFVRNMVTAASTADAAVVLIDAARGVTTQTRRHSVIVHLLGVRHVVLAVNKMDLVGHHRAAFDRIVADYAAFAGEIGLGRFDAIPTAGLHGDNVVARSEHMSWYRGPTLLGYLEQVPSAAEKAGPFRMPVQLVTGGWCSGTVAHGTARVGNALTALPSGRPVRVDEVLLPQGTSVTAGQAVSVRLSGAPVARGDLLAAEPLPAVATRVSATLVWLSDDAMTSADGYELKIGTRTVAARLAEVTALIDVERGREMEGRALRTNDVARCVLDMDEPIVMVPYAESQTLGGFILIDRASHATVAAGMVEDIPFVPSEVEGR